MTIKPLTDDFAVSAQIRIEDVPAYAEHGFKVLIVNRPDGEDPGQPRASDMRAAAEAAGMSFHEIPMVATQFDDDMIARTKAAADEGKTLAYCRSGMRSSVLWALSQARSLPADEIVAAAAKQGYDIAGLGDYLRLMARAKSS